MVGTVSIQPSADSIAKRWSAWRSSELTLGNRVAIFYKNPTAPAKVAPLVIAAQGVGVRKYIFPVHVNF